MNEFIQNITPIQMTGVLLLLAVIAHFALGVILKQIKKHTGGTKTQIDDYLINSLSAPLKLLIWYGWIYFSLHELKVEILTLGKVVEYIDIAPIFILTWGILRLISSIESFMLEKEGNVDKDSVRLFTRLIKILFVFAIVLGVAQYFGYSVSSILTLGGVGGIVVGLVTYGHKVIATVGTGITELTPSRGFAATLAAATTVVLASGTGLPISTTHTLVGAVLGVGLARGMAALNLRVIGTIAMSWLITLPAGAGLAILFFFMFKGMFG